MDKPLLKAAEDANYATVKSLLARGADPNARDGRGLTAVMIAADHNDERTLDYLLHHGGRSELKDPEGLTALGHGMPPSDTLVDWNIKHKIKCSPADSAFLVDQVNNTMVIGAFDESAIIGLVDRYRGLGMNLNQAGSEDGDLMLTAAIEYDYARLVGPLLKRGAKPDGTMGNGPSALIAIAGKNRYDDDLDAAASALIQSGARVNFREPDGTTPLIRAAANGRVKKLIQLLVSHGAEVNTRDNQGTTALMACARNGDLAGVKFLLSAYADPNLKNVSGQTAADILRQELLVIDNGVVIPPPGKLQERSAAGKTAAVVVQSGFGAKRPLSPWDIFSGRNPENEAIQSVEKGRREVLEYLESLPPQPTKPAVATDAK